MPRPFSFIISFVFFGKRIGKREQNLKYSLSSGSIVSELNIKLASKFRETKPGQRAHFHKNHQCFINQLYKRIARERQKSAKVFISNCFFQGTKECSGDFKVTHQVPANRWSLFQARGSLFSGRCSAFYFCDGRTDTMCENKDHLFGRGLVGQKRSHCLSKNCADSFFLSVDLLSA